MFECVCGLLFCQENVMFKEKKNISFEMNEGNEGMCDRLKGNVMNL